MSFPWFSLEQIEAVPIRSRPAVALVSIATDPEDFANPEGFGAVLRVRFDDLTPESAELTYVPPGFHIRLFSEDDARRIWEFAMEARKKSLKVWVHCRMGISRSVAVAAALGTLLENGGQDAFERALPNLYVYRIMMWVGQRLLDEQFLSEDAPSGTRSNDAAVPPNRPDRSSPA